MNIMMPIECVENVIQHVLHVLDQAHIVHHAQETAILKTINVKYNVLLIIMGFTQLTPANLTAKITILNMMWIIYAIRYAPLVISVMC